MVAWLHGGYLMPACKLGSKQHTTGTPFSVAGPGCSGSVLSNARVSRSRTIIDRGGRRQRVLAHRAGRQHAYVMGPPKEAPACQSRDRGRLASRHFSKQGDAAACAKSCRLARPQLMS